MSATNVQIVQPKAQNTFYWKVLTNPSDEIKNRINIYVNGTATACNCLTFLNSNFFHIDAIQEGIEKLSDIATKCSTAAQGFVNIHNANDKKNLVALIGAALEIPIAMFSSGFNLFLARGVAAGMNQYYGVIARTKKRDAEGKEEYFESFKNEGYIQGLKTSLKQVPKYCKELVTKPFEKEEIFPRLSFLCSTFMVLGPLLYACKLEKLGVVLRDFFGGAEAIALMTDKDPNAEEKGKSKFVMAGIFWTIGAILDYLKRIPFISDMASNMSELSLGVDRIGAVFYTFGNQKQT